MRKYQQVEHQFVGLENCEKNLFEAIQRRQEQLQKQLKDRVDKYNCELKRNKQIIERNTGQQIKDPRNEGIFRYLGNCIADYEMTDVEEIRNRQLEREKEMERMKQCRSLQRLGEVWEREEGVQRRQEKKQIPWKLARKLREQEVQQNRKRIEKQLSNKLQKIGVKYK